MSHLKPHPLSVPSALALPPLRSPDVLRHKLVLKNTNTKKNNSPRAQTTRLASYGPVFLVTGLPVVYFVVYKSYTQ